MSRFLSFTRSAKITIASIVALLLLLAALTTFALMERAREREQLAALLTQANFTLSESLNNPAIFTHESVEDLASLHQSTTLLIDLQTKLQTKLQTGLHTQAGDTGIYLTRASHESGLQYIDYLNRIAKKLNEVCDAQGQTEQALTDYQASQTALQSLRVAQRTAIVQTLERNRVAVRSATELAYQEASLLQRLLEQYPYMVSLVSHNLNASLLIDPSSWTSFKGALQKETDRRNVIRHQFNPAAY